MTLVAESQASPYDPLLLSHGCPSAWCIAYEITRFGRVEDLLSKPLDIKLQFDVGGLCRREPSQWSVITNNHVGMEAKAAEFHLEDASGCTIDIVKPALVMAESGGNVMSRHEGPTVDFTDQLKAIQRKRDVEAARQQRLAADRKQKEANEAARLAQIQAEESARAAEERRKIRAACSAIYQSSIDKKVRDLTVREEQQVRACQASDLYPPR